MNDCPFQVERVPTDDGVRFVLKNVETNEVLTSSANRDRLVQKRNELNTEWFFSKYIGG